MRGGPNSAVRRAGAQNSSELQPESLPMKLSRLARVLLAATAPLVAASAVRAALPRFPQPYGDRIVFVADGNIWSVDKNGGGAERLTSALGQDMFPRVSPDGKWIAYTEASKAGTDVWVIPAWGGPARRLTFHPTTEAGTGGNTAPTGRIADRPMRPHVLYRANPYWDCNALCDANGRNWNSSYYPHKLHQTPGTVNIG